MPMENRKSPGVREWPGGHGSNYRAAAPAVPRLGREGRQGGSVSPAPGHWPREGQTGACRRTTRTCRRDQTGPNEQEITRFPLKILKRQLDTPRGAAPVRAGQGGRQTAAVPLETVTKAAGPRAVFPGSAIHGSVQGRGLRLAAPAPWRRQAAPRSKQRVGH